MMDWYNEPHQTWPLAGDLHMKKVIALAIIAAGIYAASTLNIKIEVTTNAAQACSSNYGC